MRCVVLAIRLAADATQGLSEPRQHGVASRSLSEQQRPGQPAGRTLFTPEFQLRNALGLMTAVLVAAACSEAPIAGPSALDTEALLARGGSGAIVVSGSGHMALGIDDDWRSFSFHAQVRGNGNLGGRFELHARQSDPDVVIKGDIHCLSVDGNGGAWLAGVVTKSNAENAPVGSYTTWRAVDNGEGNAAPADQISLMLVGTIDPIVAESFCDNQTLRSLFEIAAGNIQVH